MLTKGLKAINKRALAWNATASPSFASLPACCAQIRAACCGAVGGPSSELAPQERSAPLLLRSQRPAPASIGLGGARADGRRNASSRGQVGVGHCAQRREGAVAELVDPLGAREVLEVVLAEVADGDVDEVAGGLGHEDLTAVAGGRDAGDAVTSRPT